MKKLRQWLINKAPIWARASLQAENEALQKENERLHLEIDKLNAYIQGLQYGMKVQRRITINTGGDKNCVT